MLFSWRILSAQRQFSTDSTRWAVKHFRTDDEFKQAMPYVVCLAVLMEISYILGDNIVKMIDILAVARDLKEYSRFNTMKLNWQHLCLSFSPLSSFISFFFSEALTIKSGWSPFLDDLKRRNVKLIMLKSNYINYFDQTRIIWAERLFKLQLLQLFWGLVLMALSCLGNEVVKLVYFTFFHTKIILL